MLGGALLQASCAWGPQASRLRAFREFLQYLIYTVVHCYHSQCLCLCMCELQKTDPEGFCIPEEFQNHLMAVVVGGEGVRSCSFQSLLVQRWHAPAVCLERKFAKFFSEVR